MAVPITDCHRPVFNICRTWGSEFFLRSGFNPNLHFKGYFTIERLTAFNRLHNHLNNYLYKQHCWCYESNDLLRKIYGSYLRTTMMETHTSPCLQSNVFTFVQSSERVFRRKVCIIGTHTGSEPVKRGPRVYPGQITWSGETPGSTYSNPMIIKLRQCFMLL